MDLAETPLGKNLTPASPGFLQPCLGDVVNQFRGATHWGKIKFVVTAVFAILALHPSIKGWASFFLGFVCQLIAPILMSLGLPQGLSLSVLFSMSQFLVRLTN